MLAADFVSRFFDGLFESRNEKQQEGSDGDGDKSEIPVQIKHDEQHADDGQHINGDIESRAGGEGLNGLHVRGNGAEQRASLMLIVVGEGKLLQVMVGAHAEIVGDPLADAGGVVVGDVGGGSAEEGDDDGGDRGGGRDLHFATAVQERAEQMLEPGAEFVRANDIVENDFQGPGSSDTHDGLNDHGD